MRCHKDDASFCYCAYVLRISRNSGFLRMVLTNMKIFLRGLYYAGKVDLTHSGDNGASICKETAIHCLIY